MHVSGSKIRVDSCSVLGAGLWHSKAQQPEMKAEEGALEQQEMLSCRVGARRYHGGAPGGPGNPECLRQKQAVVSGDCKCRVIPLGNIARTVHRQ